MRDDVSRHDFMHSAAAVAAGAAVLANRPRRGTANSSTAAGLPGLDLITVSPAGIANGQSAVTNNGAQFGPDTPGTTTQGLQEAVSYAITQVTGLGITGAPPRLYLGAGTFSISGTITLPVPSDVPANGSDSRSRAQAT